MFAPLASIAKILSLKSKTDLAAALNPVRHLSFAGSARAFWSIKLRGRKGPRRGGHSLERGPLTRIIRQDLARQRIFDSEKRSIECGHNLMFLGDAFELLCRTLDPVL